MSGRKNFKAIDLFCGCGGLTLGLKQAGFNVIGAIDNDPLAVETYAMNHLEVYVWQRDIRNLSGDEIMEKFNLRKGELDLLAGCPPCQGFSTMRTLKGKRKIKDKRNDLVFEFLRLVEELEPKSRRRQADGVNSLSLISQSL
jgi:DNA (cytosine-5)-methyltransferase 1